MVTKWVREINLLSNIAVTQPQAAYMCFVDGYKNKFTYFLRTIFGIEEFLTPLDEVIRHKFIPAVTGGHIVNDNERKLLALPPRLGGLGIDVFCKNATIEYENSRNMTASLISQILMVNNEEGDKSKQQIQSERRRRYQQDLEALRAEMTDEEKRINESNMRTGVSNWLTTLPLTEWGYDLIKEQFWDAIKIRYNWQLERLPSNCICGVRFDLSHALSCKKGGLVTLRHNEIRNITADLLKEVCKDVRVEPSLLEINGERFQQRMANDGNESRLDVSALRSEVQRYGNKQNLPEKRNGKEEAV
ncbi:uncharacterized protein LOC130613444 [Hydractinia symbiolongicarpus]|uniref:uncharacterized protein LOC130613444 n=1 Tax=Hydractinia symbiolongicarpus TaxID=13093 RepID=UPI00254CF026|nr:uncharacterized protein LOC130613444 [Hydractinia symbiolongicarpus]